MIIYSIDFEVKTKESTFLFILARFDNFRLMGYQKAARGYPRKESRTFRR